MCWVPIFKAKKLILAGDPLQLPPTILSLDKDRKKRDGKKKGNGKKQTQKCNNGGKPSKLQGAKGEEGEGDLEGSSASSPVGEDESTTETEEEQDDNDNDDSDDTDDAAVKEGGGEEGAKCVERKDTTAAANAPKRTTRAFTAGELRPPHTLETTLFDRLETMYGPGIKRMLQVQYRSVYSLQPTHPLLHLLTCSP